MYYIAGAVLIVYFLLFIFSYREELPEGIPVKGNKGIWKPFYRMGYFLFCLWQDCVKESSRSKRIQKWLKKLNPHMDGELLVKGYFTEQIGIVLAIVLFGTVLGGIVWIQSGQSSKLKGNHVYRDGYNRVAQQIQLEADVEGEGKLSFEIGMSGQMPKRSQAEEMELIFWEEMKKIIPGNNPSLEQVWMDLNLVNALEGYPFSVEWSSSRPDILDDYGWVGTVEEGGAERAVLTAKVIWGAWEWSHELGVTLIPPPKTDAERQREDLEVLIKAAEEDSRDAAFWELPTEWEGKSIRWKEKKEDYSILLWGLSVAAAVAVFFLGDHDLETRLTVRQQQMKESYPSIVSKLMLYLGAGMNVRRALCRIAERYEDDLATEKSVRPAYEELLYMCRELKAGLSEAEAYERMGKRSGVQEYIRLGAVLSQNLKKGSGTLLERLQEEADRTRREQMSLFRQKGETVSTKLLIPMVMMLGIVMVMIMIPAFGAL